MTQAQINTELTKIRKGAMTLNEYIRLSRVGETFAMTRAQRKEVYTLYLEEVNSHKEQRAFKLKNRLSKKGAYAYDAITKERDEVMLVTA